MTLKELILALQYHAEGYCFKSDEDETGCPLWSSSFCGQELAKNALKYLYYGHWNKLPDNSLECSNCGSIAPYEENYYGEIISAPKYEYCPHCGAKMD